MGRQSMMDLCQDILALCESIQADLAGLRAQRRKVAYLQLKDAEASSPVLQVHEDPLEVLQDVAKLFVEDDSSDPAVACDEVPSELQVASQDKRAEGVVAATSAVSKADLGITAGMVSKLGFGVMFMRPSVKPPYDFPSSVNRLSCDNCDFSVDAVKVLPIVNLLCNDIGNFDKPPLLRRLFGNHEWFDPGGRIHNKEEVTSNDKCKRFPAEIEDVITENLRRGEGSVKPENLQSLVSFEKIFEKLEDGACNCTVATIVAEISLTIDGMFYVIDSEDGKMEVYKAKVGMDALQMFLVSKVAVDQRIGCVCRTGPSTCYWLHTSSVCVKELLPSTVLEIQQTNLGQENIWNSMYQLEGVGSVGSLIRSWKFGKRLANLKGTTNGFNGYIEIGRGRYGFVHMTLLPGVTPLNNHIESYFHMVFCAYILQGCGLIERCASSFCLLLNELGMVRDVVEWQSVPQKFGDILGVKKGGGQIVVDTAVVAQCWDCKFIVTLATLSAKKFSDLLGSVSISNSVGRTFPLNILYSKTSCENYVGATKQDTTIHITGKEKIEAACCYIAERMEQLVSSAKIVPDLFQLPADEQAIHRLTACGRMIHLGDQLIELSDGDTKVMETFSASKLLGEIEIEVNESCAIDMLTFSGGEKSLVVVMFSQPRPPDNLNLEDKVGFEGGWDDKPSDIFLVPLEDHDKGMASGTSMAEHQGELCDISCSMGYFSCVLCYVV